MNLLSRFTALAVVLLLASPSLGHEEEPRRLLVEVRLSDVGADDPVAPNPLRPSGENFRRSILKLRSMAADPAVLGIRLHADGDFSYPHALDVVRELRGFRSAGKKVVCYVESLSRDALMYASVADPLVVPPSAESMLEGPVAEALYMKDLLAKLGVQFEVMHIGDFKTAFEDFARDSMSEEQRATIQDIVDEYYRQCVETIATNRGIEPAAVESLFDQWICSPEDLRKAGVIDAVAYEDEFEQQVSELLGEVEEVEEYGGEGEQDLEELMSNPLAFFSLLPKLLGQEEEELPDGPRIAIVYASGLILSGKSTSGFQGQVMGSETIVEALDQVAEDEDVKAVVFRVNSPGGSALASDMIWRAIERVKRKKPVIASMGSVAGSGGYWISMGCQKILAQPSTITGSIGVVSAIPDLSGTLSMVGVNVETVGAGPRWQDLTTLTGVSPFLRKKLTYWMWEVYESFIAKAATGRGMDPKELEKHARGRAWTGRQAKELGLIDALGGLDEAIVLACHMAGGLDAESTPILELPRPPDFFTQLEEAFGEFLLERSAAQELAGWLRLYGFGDVIPVLSGLLRAAREREGEWVQCVVPFHLRVR